MENVLSVFELKRSIDRSSDEVIIKGFVLKVNRVYPQPVKKLLTVAKKNIILLVVDITI